MGVQVQTVNAIVNQRLDVADEIAVGLGRVLNTVPGLRTNLQTTCDLFGANMKLRKAA
jgi:plasmid maintenance system antidote protein VapI